MEQFQHNPHMEQIARGNRRNEIFRGILPSQEIITADLRDAMLRLMVDRKNGGSDTTFRTEDTPQFKKTVPKAADLLMQKNKDNHFLLRHLDSKDKTHPLIEEYLIWNIDCERQLSPQTAKTIFDVVSALYKLPTNTQMSLDFPLHMVGHIQGHSTRVAMYAGLLAEAINAANIGYRINPNLAAIGGFCHDFGKLEGGQKKILKKRQNKRFANNEFNTIKQHPVFGATAFNQLKELNDGRYFPTNLNYYQFIHDIILKHHVRPDHDERRSYPFEISPNELNPIIQIITLVDSFDAMTSRDYHEGDSEVQKKIVRAYQEVQRCKGTQFDPEIADVFTEMYPEPKFFKEYIRMVKQLFNGN